MVMVLSGYVNQWLNAQGPWVQYKLIRELEERPREDVEVRAAHENVFLHPLVRSIIDELHEWPGPPMKRHNDSKLLYHKLAFLADLDLLPDHPGMTGIVERILSEQSEDGPFHIMGNIPTFFGGSGKDESIWMLCDAPLLIYSLVKMGYGHDPRVSRAVTYLLSIIRDFGWPCAASSKLGKKFKGPGKRTDPCPYANLLMLKLLSVLPEFRQGKEALSGCNVILDLWEHRKEVKYFMFGMGTDFAKLKAPFIWYDILHVTDILTRFDNLGGDHRLKALVHLIEEKADENGLYKAESVYRAWKDWDFGQKKEASGWITLQVYIILKRWDKIYQNAKST